MEQVGALIVNLHRNLQEIRASLDVATANGKTQGLAEAQLMHGTIDRAEAALRAQARQFVAAASSSGVAAVGGGAQPLGASVTYPPARQSSLRRFGAAAQVSPRGLPPAPEDLLPRSPAVPSYGRNPPKRAPSGGSRVRARTTGAMRQLPRPNRLDPLHEAPSITERDLQAGLCSLVTRGFIPHAADLTPAMERGVPVMQNRPAMLYDQALKHERRDPAPADMTTVVRMDVRDPGPAGMSTSSASGMMHERSQDFAYESTASAASARRLPPLAPAPAGALPLPAPPASSAYPAEALAQNFGTFCTEIADTDGAQLDSHLALEPPPPIMQAQQYEKQRSEAEVRRAAATLIGARWRGKQQRLRFKTLRRRDASARRLQRAWAASMTRAATRHRILELQEEERKMQTRMMFELSHDWFQIKQLRRVEVHVCSLTIPESRRRSMEGYSALQASQICRMFRLCDPKKDVVLVAPKALHEDILDYYSKIMQLRGVKNPVGRFQIVVPENMGLMPHMSLTQALLCSPKALRRIRRLTSGRTAMLFPQVVTQAELKLSSQLKLPMLGATARNMALLSSKSNAKKLCQLARVPIGPWSVDIYDEDEFYTSLATLLVRHPHIRTWVFKIDDERDSRGHAYVDLQKMKEVMDALRASMQAAQAEMAAGRASCGAGGVLGTSSASSSQTALALQGHLEPLAVALPVDVDTSEVRHLLRRYLPRRVALCNRRAYPDFAAWMAEATRVGVVIQAVPEGMLSQTSVHVQIDPDGAVGVLGTSEAAQSSPFVRAASWYPHSRGSWEALREIGLRMGRVLAAKGLVGHASVDVVFQHNPDFDMQLYANQGAEEGEQEPQSTVIGGGTPVNPRALMFANLRSPSPAMSDAVAPDGRPYTASPEPPPSLPESRQADYELAAQLPREDATPEPSQQLAQDPVSLLLGGQDGAEPGATAASPYACWVVDVDARLTDEAANLWPLQFVAQLRLDSTTGCLHLAPEAPPPENAAQMSEEERYERSQRWALVSHAAHAPGLERMNYQSLFQAAKMRGVSFDLFNNVGCVFTFLDVFHSLFSLLAVDRTPESCAKRLSTAAGVISEGPSAAVGGQRGKHRDVAASSAAAAAEVQDGPTVADVQTAMRTVLKRWSEKPRQAASMATSASV
eukprot:TRINITY_DN18446_c0_g1_i2.p1 TRINITY_DN18446_c0_g1~~TRINITY_DN18446_c0_g1_i2.p1  ORF type:complete len:1145 (+),score=244.00 TRINITY_DN18446_c0_g1_i2:211-3645(+)